MEDPNGTMSDDRAGAYTALHPLSKRIEQAARAATPSLLIYEIYPGARMLRVRSAPMSNLAEAREEISRLATIAASYPGWSIVFDARQRPPRLHAFGAVSVAAMVLHQRWTLRENRLALIVSSLRQRVVAQLLATFVGLWGIRAKAFRAQNDAAGWAVGVRDR